MNVGRGSCAFNFDTIGDEYSVSLSANFPLVKIALGTHRTNCWVDPSGNLGMVGRRYALPLSGIKLRRSVCKKSLFPKHQLSSLLFIFIVVYRLKV